MPFLAKPAWPVVSEHLRYMFLSVALWLADLLFLYSFAADLVVTDDDEVIFIWELC
ncbi:hypothetical protein Hanom_Chr16g01429981 [Helianthus anomalus]